MREIVTKELDFLESFKINQLIKGGVTRIKHPSLYMIDFSKEHQQQVETNVFLSNVEKRFYEEKFDIIYSNFNKKNKNYSNDKLHNSFLFYMLKNMLPHLHFLELYGTQPCEHTAQFIFNMRAHYTLVDKEGNVIKEINKDDADNNSTPHKQMNLSIDKLAVTQDKEQEYIEYKLLKPILDNMGYSEFTYSMYPDELKMLMIDMVNRANSYFIEKLYDMIPIVNMSIMDKSKYYTIILKNAHQIAFDSNRGLGSSVIISEDLLNDMFSHMEGFDGLYISNYIKADRTFRFMLIKGDKYNWIVDTKLEGKRFLIGYCGDNEMDAGIFFTPEIGDFNIYVDNKNMLKYFIPTTTVNNTFGVESYFKQVIFS